MAVEANKSKAVKNQMVLVFIGYFKGKLRLCRVCQKNHRANSTRPCQRAHSVPSTDVLWFGTWRKDELGDLQSELRRQRKEFRKANSSWFYKRRCLLSISPAPSFKAWHDKEIIKHNATKPEFVFVPPKR